MEEAVALLPFEIDEFGLESWSRSLVSSLTGTIC